MKTFLTVSSKVLILAAVLFVLASNAAFAGVKHIPEATEDATHDTYSDALRELEMFIPALKILRIFSSWKNE